MPKKNEKVGDCTEEDGVDGKPGTELPNVVEGTPSAKVDPVAVGGTGPLNTGEPSRVCETSGSAADTGKSC